MGWKGAGPRRQGLCFFWVLGLAPQTVLNHLSLLYRELHGLVCWSHRCTVRGSWVLEAFGHCTSLGECLQGIQDGHRQKFTLTLGRGIWIPTAALSSRGHDLHHSSTQRKRKRRRWCRLFSEKCYGADSRQKSQLSPSLSWPWNSLVSRLWLSPEMWFCHFPPKMVIPQPGVQGPGSCCSFPLVEQLSQVSVSQGSHHSLHSYFTALVPDWGGKHCPPLSSHPGVSSESFVCSGLWFFFRHIS